MKIQSNNDKERESFYESIHKEISGSITTNDIETLYNTSICVLVRSYESIQLKFNEIKSQSWAEIAQGNIDSKNLVHLCFIH